MFNPTTVLADAFGEHLAEVYMRVFGGREARYAGIIAESARLMIERLAGSDALYHTAEHTALVTLVAQDIMRGKRMSADVTPSDWVHMIFAALAHDCGYLRGVCLADRPGHYVIDTAGNTISPPLGASDAFLAPYHVERSKIAVRERLGTHDFLDAERIARAIELTRFPVPDDGDHAETDTEAGLVRAADLIGQLGDPLYLRKLNALYQEFAEIGVNEKLGYRSPADVADLYPKFYWSKVEPYIRDGIRYLDRTMEGRQWVAHLHSHVFAVEHQQRTMGPEPRRGLR